MTAGWTTGQLLACVLSAVIYPTLGSSDTYRPKVSLLAACNDFVCGRSGSFPANTLCSSPMKQQPAASRSISLRSHPNSSDRPKESLPRTVRCLFIVWVLQHRASLYIQYFREVFRASHIVEAGAPPPGGAGYKPHAKDRFQAVEYKEPTTEFLVHICLNSMVIGNTSARSLQKKSKTPSLAFRCGRSTSYSNSHLHTSLGEGFRDTERPLLGSLLEKINPSRV